MADLEWLVLKNDLDGIIRKTERVKSRKRKVYGDIEQTHKAAEWVVAPLRGFYDDHDLDKVVVAVNEGLINGVEYVLECDPKAYFEIEAHLMEDHEDYQLVTINYGGDGFKLEQISIEPPQRWKDEEGKVVALKRNAGHSIMGAFCCVMAYDNRGKDLYMLFPLTKCAAEKGAEAYQ
jgi:hypothetical protein